MLDYFSLLVLPLIIITILTIGIFKKVPIYEVFVDGAKDGFSVSIKIIPYLVAIIVAINMFKASGAIDILASLLGNLLDKLSIPVDVLPLILTRSLSGSATLGIFSDIANTHGSEAFVTKLAAVMVGSSETTFYVLTVYFGSIGIKKFRYALLTGILADVIGIVLAILVARMFFLPNIA